MPSLPVTRSNATSTLTRALRRLDEAENRLRVGIEESERRLAGWEERWQRRRDRITQRMHAVDGQLAVLVGDFGSGCTAEVTSRTTGTPPMLGIVGAPSDSASMSSMVAN